MSTAIPSQEELRMLKSPFLAAALLAATLAIPARAQDMKKDAPIKPADSPSKVLLDSWNDIGRKLIAMAEDFPEDKYDFKPTPAQRSFAEQLLHAAGANYFFINPVTGQKSDVEAMMKRDKYKDKAAIVAFVKKAFADGAAALQAKGDKGLSDQIVEPFSHQYFRVDDLAWSFIEHSGEHYGQLVVYYRLAGLVPPNPAPRNSSRFRKESRGCPILLSRTSRKRVGTFVGRTLLSVAFDLVLKNRNPPYRYPYGFLLRRSGKIFTITSPATNPPTCAQNATPPASRPDRPPDNVCAPDRKLSTNHSPSTIHAGRYITNTKNQVSTRARGYKMKYAPSTPAIAPLAPTVGTVECGFTATCVAIASSPHNR